MANELTIPEYTAEDYDTSKPYEWLYSHRQDKFMLKQLTQKMKAQAGNVGVKGFIGLFNAYCESQAARQGVSLERSTEFDNQPVELMCGEYICNEKIGVAITDKFGYIETICRHAIMPVRRLINIDSGEERLEIAYKKGRTWRTLIAEKTVIASSSQILQLAAYGIIVNSDNAKALSTYLLAMEEMNYDTIPEQKSAGRLGWIGEHGFSPYVEHIVFDGDSKYKDIFESIQPHGSMRKWIDAVKKIRAEKTPARIYIAASFASAILEPCGLLPFFVHAWGGQGNGKTVAMMIGASVWASPVMGDYVKTFDATDVGQEKVAAFLNSLPLCLDELQIQSAAGVKDFDKMIYKLTEGVGRIRGAKNGGIQQMAKWKNCMLTSGEDPIINPNSMGGATARVIEFEFSEKAYSDLLGILEIINQNYGHAGRPFVEYLQSDGAEDRVREIQKTYYRELLQCDGVDKQAASASAILAADQIATELFFQDGNALTVNDLSAVLTKRKDVDVNARALEYIYEMVSRNQIHFKPDDAGMYKAEVWGKVDDSYIYIIKSAFDQQMALGGYNGTSFLSWAARREILKSGKGRRLLNVRFGASVLGTVCLKIDKDKLEDIVSDDTELPF